MTTRTSDKEKGTPIVHYLNILLATGDVVEKNA